MNRILELLAFILLLTAPVSAQKLHGVNWITGSGQTYKIHFKDTAPAISPFNLNFQYYFDLGTSCISDTEGSFRLWCNGYRLMDSTGATVDGGDTVTESELCKFQYGFSNYSQASLIIPFGNNEYGVVVASATDSAFNSWFTPNPFGLFDLLQIHYVDMKLNNGNGKLVKTKTIMQKASLSRTQMMACRHADGKSWWLLKQGHDSNIVYKFILTKDSIYEYGNQFFGLPACGNVDILGQSMFSNNGKRYATVVYGSNLLFYADFDRCTGLLSNPKVRPLPNHAKAPSIPVLDTLPGGLCFSPTDSFLYVAKEYNIYQLDLYEPDSNLAWYHVANMDTSYNAFMQWSCIYSANDGKLYIGNWNGLGSAMSVISNPNAKGAACAFCPKCLRFPTQGSNNPPCMPNYALGKDTTVICWPMGLNESGREEREAQECSVYPNPAQTQLTIESEAFKKGLNSLRIFNLMGQCVLEEAFKTVSGKHTVSVQGLPSGVYMLKVNNMVRRVLIE